MSPEERHWRNVGFALAVIMFGLAVLLFVVG